MPSIGDMLRALVHVLQALLRAIPELIELILRVVRLYCRRRKGGEGTPIDCLPVPPEIYLRPDASLYSQGYLMSLGLAVTWDNPDIELVDASSSVVSSYDLQPATTYTVRATIHNRSNSAPAIAMPVHFTLFSFGVGGTTAQAIGSRVVNLPVRGAPGEPVAAEVTWTTPATAGHYCIQVDAICVDDANPLDNTGQENTVVQGGRPGERLDVRIPVRNRLQGARAFHAQVHSYTLPDRPILPIPAEPATAAGEARAPQQETARERTARLNRIVAANAAQKHPAPAEWQPALSHRELALEENGVVELGFSVTIPSSASKGLRQPFNVVVVETGTGRLLGGVTLIVVVE
jgi:hypothetical protein